MNIENMKILRDFIVSIPEENFDHENWTRIRTTYEPVMVENKNVCGTAACIAGWANIISGEVPWREHGKFVFFDDPNIDHAAVAAEWLGLNEEEAYTLFMPDVYYSDTNVPLDFIDGLRAQASADHDLPSWMNLNTTKDEVLSMLEMCITAEQVEPLFWKIIKGED